MNKGAWSAAAGLAAFGATPAVVGLVAVGAFGALAAGASGIAVVVVVILTLLTHLYGQERKGKWRREELKVEYEGTAAGEGKEVVKRLQRRRNLNAERDQPTLFNDQEPTP